LLTSLQGTNAAAEGGKEVLLAISRELRESPEEGPCKIAAQRPTEIDFIATDK